ncbi:hypothetical protein JXA02_09600, partial [candidate division KSB1 bacterium]|nr:hypothetical protein [candidate division KSB1 bacterium]
MKFALKKAAKDPGLFFSSCALVFLWFCVDFFLTLPETDVLLAQVRGQFLVKTQKINLVRPLAATKNIQTTE